MGATGNQPSPYAQAERPPDLPGHAWAEVLVGLVGVGGQPARAVGHHRRQLGEAEAQDDAGAGDEEEDRDGGRPHALHGVRADSRDEERAGEADHEGPPPVGFPL